MKIGLRDVNSYYIWIGFPRTGTLPVLCQSKEECLTAVTKPDLPGQFHIQKAHFVQILISAIDIQNSGLCFPYFPSA